MKNNKKKEIFSKVFPNGTMLEVIHDPKTGETNLVVSESKSSQILDKYTDEKGVEWFPFPSDSDLITKGFVKLPSASVQYGGLQNLYQEVRDFIAEYVKLPEDFLTISAVYTIFTWVYDRFHTIPYLRVTGDLGTGKTRFLQVVGHLCYKATLAGGSTSTAAVFRLIDMIGGTFVFDEADFKNSEMWSEVVKILNSGHTEDSPVTRMEVKKKDGEMSVKTFNVFGPKVLASRERFGDNALESRCVTEHLLPMKDVKRPIHLDETFKQRSLSIRDRLLAFRFDYFARVSANELSVEGIELPRLKQTALALTSISSLIGNEVLEEVKKYFGRYEKEFRVTQKYDVKADVVVSMINIIKKRKKDSDVSEKIYMLEIKNEFEKTFGDDYSEKNEKLTYYPGISISARKIGVHIRNLGIKPERDGKGFYIPYIQELKTIESLAERYGFDMKEELPDKMDTKNEEENEINPDDIPF